MTTPGLPLQVGDRGAAVRDLCARLASATARSVVVTDAFDDALAGHVEAFQHDRGLLVDGICGPQTWAALVEAGSQLGDRMLYLRSPMTRGDDVAELQQQLGGLGFDAGWVDGIFGPDTERAVRDFQNNQGLAPDGVVGRDTVRAIARIVGRITDSRTVASVREIESLHSHHLGLEGRRVVVGEEGGIPTVVDALARRLRLDGAEVLSLHHPDLSSHAQQANQWNGEVYVGMTLATAHLSASYFSTVGFSSVGGRALAGQCAGHLGAVLDTTLDVSGLRIPILRETRMPAVWCRIGPAPKVVQQTAQVVEAFRAAVTAWCADPTATPSTTG